MERVSLIVPTFNEAEALRQLVPAVRAYLTEPHELLVVDDDSPDGTASVAEALGARVLRRSGRRDLAGAVLDGLAAASHDLCVVMDADLSHPPSAIPALVEAVIAGAPLAIGSRYVAGGRIDGWSRRRRALSRLGTGLARPLTAVADPLSGMFCVRRSTLPWAHLRPRGFKITLEILAHSAGQPHEVPIRFTERRAGASKLSASVVSDFLRQLGRLYGQAAKRRARRASR